MLQTDGVKFLVIVVAICLLIFIEYKFELIDYLRFVNSTKTLEVSSIAYSSDGEMIAVVKKIASSKTREYRNSPRKNFQIEIQRVADNSLITSFDTLVAGNLTFSPDKSMIAAGSYDGKVYVWRVSDGELLHFFDYKINVNSSRMRFLSFTQDGQNIVTFTFGSSSKINMWNLASETNRPIAVEFISADLSSDAKTLVIASKNKAIDLYRLDDLSFVKQIKVNRKVFSLLFNSEAKKVAFISRSPPAPPENRYGRNIYVYNLEDSSLSNIFYHPTKELLENFAISPDGRYLTATYRRSVPSDFFVGVPRGSDARFYGRIRVWRIEDGKQLATFRGHKRQTYGITFSPDGKFLVSTGADGKIRFWKMPPRNYSRFWIFGGICFAAFVYWQKTSLINWISR